MVVADLAAEIDVPLLTSRCFRTGDIDVVIMAAGITPTRSVESDAELVRRVAMVNFVSQMQLGTELVQRLRPPGPWGAGRPVVGGGGTPPEPTTTCTARPRAVWMRGANGLADALIDEPIRILVVRPGMVRTRMSHRSKKRRSIATRTSRKGGQRKNLCTGPITVWVPAATILMSGLRHAPGPCSAPPRCAEDRD